MNLTEMQFAMTPRVQRLHGRLEQAFAGMHSHKLVRPQEQQAYAQLAYEAYSRNVGKPEIIRRAEFLAHFAANFPITLCDDELITGSQGFTSPSFNELFTPGQLQQAGVHTNGGHIIVDYGRVINQGIPGLKMAVNTMPEGDNRDAFILTLDAFAAFLRRHGCGGLAVRAPESFHEALQTTWFIQVFLSVEGLGAAYSFGRFDQFLWPFLQRDLDSGRCTLEQAFELVCCFFLKCCEGAESQNLTVGGNNEENPLSIIVLQAMRELKVWQPSISVRIDASTSDMFWHEALMLCDTGIGMPSFFNDPVVITGLQKLDISVDRATDWGIVGCYEASPQGDAYPMTVGGGFALPEILWAYLQTGSEHESFGSFYEGFKAYFADTYRESILPGFSKCWLGRKQSCPSPFESLCVTGCIESALATEEGGARFNLFGVNILGIGTLIDSLLSIKTLIFDEKEITLAEMTQQLAENFPDRNLQQHCRSLPGKFGSDTAESNALARELSGFIAGEVVNSRLPNGVRPYPGFFWFGQDIHRQIGASADGRLANERPSYGCGPGVLLENSGVTAILNSAACIDHADCACGNPLTLSFNRSELQGETGLKLLRQVVDIYFASGGFHLHMNIVDAEDLKKAKATPARYQDLTVRISGFSARFVNLDARWQDAIIERTARRM